MSDRRSPTDFYGAPELGALQRRTGVAAPSVQPTMSDLWSAQTTVSRADLPSAEQDRHYDAYAPIIDRLNQGRPWSQRYHNPFAGGANPDLYLFDETGSPRLKAPSQAEGEATIWGAVEAARAADPNAYADLPPSIAAFHGQIKTKAKGALRDARGVINRNESWAGTGVELAAGAVTGFRDQYQIMSMPIGGIGRNFATRVLTAGLGNMAVEAAEQPLVARERGKLDETLTAKEAAINIGAAGLFGSALQGVGDLAGAGVKAAVASDAGQAAVGKIGGAFADGRALAQRARSAIGANRMTSEERLAAKVLDREADVADLSPFVAGAGTDAHMARMEQARQKLVAGVADIVPDVPRGRPANLSYADAAAIPRRGSAPGSIAGLAPDRVIRFVINDLEGGSAVVHYNKADGGMTKYGIASRHNPGIDVANLTEESAAAISRRRYWKPALDRVDPREAAVAFDAGFIGGPEASGRILGASKGDWRSAVTEYRQFLNDIADRNPAKEKYRKGWMARVDKLEAFISREGGDVEGPALRRDQFDDGENGDTAWSVAQREVDEATRALDAANADAPRAAPEAEDPFDPRSWDVDPEPSVRDRPEEPMPSRALADDAADTPSLIAPRVPEPVEAAAPTTVPTPSADLKANVRADATDDTMLSSVFVKPKAEPGFHIEDSHGDGHFLYSVFRDEAGVPKGVVRFPATDEARNLIPGERGDYVTSYVDPAYRRQGIATRLYDQLRDAGHDVDQLSGGHDLTPDGAAFASNRRGRAIRAAEAVAEDATPPRAEPIAGFDDPDDTAATRQLDSLEHDLRQFLDEDDARGMTVQLTEDGEVINAADVLADLDLDDAAIDAARNCL